MAAEVALSLITLRSSQARLAIAEANLANQLQTLQLTDWRAQAGLLSALEVEQARAASAQTQAQLPALQTAVAQTSHALAVLTGQPPAALAHLVATPAPVPQAQTDLALSLPAETLRQRPDVRAAEQQVLAAHGRVAQADAARYPSFRLGGSLGLSALTLGTLSSSAALASTLLAGVNWTLWDGGAANAQVRAEQAALDQAQAGYRGTVLTALQEVEDALVALRGDRERALRLQQATTAALQAARLARQRYDSGLVDFQTVLETQRTQLSTQDSLATATAGVSADHVRLFKALGGGWSPSDTATPLSATHPPERSLPMNTPTPPVQPAAPVPAVKPATAKPATADIQALLGTDQPARWWARPSLWIGLAVLAAAAGGIYFWQGAEREQRRARLRDRGPAQGQPDAHRGGQRHHRADARGEHRAASCREPSSGCWWM
jgi:hypothetical protein